MRFSRFLDWRGLAATAAMLVALPAMAQSSTDPRPVTGLNENVPDAVLLRGATLVRDAAYYASPNRDAATGDILIAGGKLVDIDESIQPPAGCIEIDCGGQYIYPGWINAYHEVDSENFSEAAVADDYWNTNIVPNRRVKNLTAVPDASKLRRTGFGVTTLAPKGRILSGRPSVWLLGESDDEQPGANRLADPMWQHATLTVPRRPREARESYPNSPMGATALVRQAMYDAAWYADATAAASANPTLPRPTPSLSLETLARALPESTFVFDAANERMAIRAVDVAREFSLSIALRGSGREYRDLDNIVDAGVPILLPINFPSEPMVATPADARDVSLQDLLAWKFAPQNPSRLIQRGATVCLTADRLDDPSSFLGNLRTAIEHGLSPADAMTALTTTPARLLGIDDRVGRLAKGMLANLIIADGDLFADGEILDVYVAGEAFEIKSRPDPALQAIAAEWQLIAADDADAKAVVSIKTKGGKLSASLKADDEDNTELKISKLIRRRDQLSGQIDGALPAIGLPDGTHQILIRPTTKSFAETSAEKSPTVTITTIGGGRTWYATKLAKEEKDESEEDEPEEDESEEDEPEEDESEKDEPDEDESDEDESDEDESDEDESMGDASEEQEASEDKVAAASTSEPSIPITPVFPLGAYGRSEPVAATSCVLFDDAIVWTCRDETDLPIPSETSDVLVRDGKIVEIAEQIDAPEGCVVIDAAGKHLTPGLIDCHSHAATDGGVNESGQVITAEVRIADFIDPTDITIYRQLAGGVTAASVLHGSANPIGGQNAVIKFRWGDSMKDLLFDDAPAGIKFALGENVKRSRRRYPNTRMGVEQILRDQFLAARKYAGDHRRYAGGARDTLPPRVDLQLEAISEIQDGTRWIHCHSYRQDEIVATLDVLDEFGIRIGSLQHILEGYKVADRMARHGAMASSFADWWAYKFEVYDAIPFNGVLMHNAGIVVSYNSDDAELGRHLNTEAAKAVKYGGVPPTEALKFVTLNPAKQLRIDDHVGSIEAGKDADLVLWSGPPLSTTSRCEQTWIDGRRMFGLDDDAAMRERDASWRAALIQSLIATKKPVKAESKTESKPKTGAKPDPDRWVDEEDRWLRYDEFCNARNRGNNS